MMAIRSARDVALDVQLARGDYRTALIQCDRLSIIKRMRRLASQGVWSGDVFDMADRLEREILHAAAASKGTNDDG